MMIWIPYSQIYNMRYLMSCRSIAVVVTNENAAADAAVFLIEIKIVFFSLKIIFRRFRTLTTESDTYQPIHYILRQ